MAVEWSKILRRRVYLVVEVPGREREKGIKKDKYANLHIKRSYVERRGKVVNSYYLEMTKTTRKLKG